MPECFLDSQQIGRSAFVRYVEVHETIGSTNDRALELAREANLQLPALVVARAQAAGRGRGTNTWWSADGGLTFSLLLEPARLGIKAAHWPRISMATAVAVCDALQEAAPDLRSGIKWPNDILIDDRKVCGILLESPAGDGATPKRLVVGVGLNVNNTHLEAPAPTRARAIALCDVTGARHPLEAILLSLLDHLAKRLEQLASEDAALPDAWQKLCCLRGHRVAVASESNTHRGLCLGIDAEGALVLECAGECKRVFSGTVCTVDGRSYRDS